MYHAVKWRVTQGCKKQYSAQVMHLQKKIKTNWCTLITTMVAAAKYVKNIADKTSREPLNKINLQSGRCTVHSLLTKKLVFHFWKESNALGLVCFITKVCLCTRCICKNIEWCFALRVELLVYRHFT